MRYTSYQLYTDPHCIFDQLDYCLLVQSHDVTDFIHKEVIKPIFQICQIFMIW